MRNRNKGEMHNTRIMIISVNELSQLDIRRQNTLIGPLLLIVALFGQANGLMGVKTIFQLVLIT